MRAISETLEVALQIADVKDVKILHRDNLERRVSRSLVGDESLTSGNKLDVSSQNRMTRNVSESQLNAIKNVGQYFLVKYFNFVI